MIFAASLSAILLLRIILTVTKIRCNLLLLHLLIGTSYCSPTTPNIECLDASRSMICNPSAVGCSTILHFNTSSFSDLAKKKAFMNESDCENVNSQKCEKLLNGTTLQVKCFCDGNLCNDVNQDPWKKEIADILADFITKTTRTTTQKPTTTVTKTATISNSRRTAFQQAKMVTLSQSAGSMTTSTVTSFQKQKLKFSKAPRTLSTAAVLTTVKYVFGEPINNCPVKVFWLRVSFGTCGFCFVYVLVCWIRNVVINHRYEQNHEKKKAERKRLEEQRRAERENAPPEERPFRRRKRLLTDLDKQVLKAKKAKWSTFEELLGILDTEMEKLRMPESESAKEPKTEEILQKPKGKPVEAEPFVEKEDETQKSSLAE